MPGWRPLRIDLEGSRYRAMIGVGGIGSGRFFELEGNHTLGREESRSGRFLDRRDYCKLHIITHYVQVLLGPGFTSLPIGIVGDDDAGRQMLEEMAGAGIDLRHVEARPGEQTPFSFCLVYPCLAWIRMMPPGRSRLHGPCYPQQNRSRWCHEGATCHDER